MPQDRINALLAELALAGLTVARLKGGDPLIFGRGSEEAAYLTARGISVEYAPGITAAQGAASSSGVPLTHRGLASGVRYVTGHRQAGQAARSRLGQPCRSRRDTGRLHGVCHDRSDRPAPDRRGPARRNTGHGRRQRNHTAGNAPRLAARLDRDRPPRLASRRSDFCSSSAGSSRSMPARMPDSWHRPSHTT